MSSYTMINVKKGWADQNLCFFCTSQNILKVPLSFLEDYSYIWRCKGVLCMDRGFCVFYWSWRQKNNLSIFIKKIRMVVQKPQENNQDIKTCLCQLLSETLAHSQTQNHRLNRDFLPIQQSADFFDYHTIYFSVLWLVHYCFHMLDFLIILQLPL